MMGSKISVASSSSSSGPVEVRQKQQEEEDSDENVVFFPSSTFKFLVYAVKHQVKLS